MTDGIGDAQRRQQARMRLYAAAGVTAADLPGHAVKLIEWLISFDDDVIRGVEALLGAARNAGPDLWLGYSDAGGFYCRECGDGIAAPADPAEHDEQCPVRVQLEAAQADGADGSEGRWGR